MTRVLSVFVAAACAAIVLSLVGRAAAPACGPDNGGLKLPEGFCATLVAENVGRGAAGGVVALRDTDGDGTLDKRERFGDNGGTGIALHNGYLFQPLTAATDALARPGGLAQGPDGSLYVTEDTKGKIWRIMYKSR
jgi:glucose/arabinose dehydrogenase